MKKTLKTILFATVATAMFFGISTAKASSNSASTVFNTNPLDFATTMVSNYTAQPGCTNCWSQSVNMSAGQIVSVRVYYHNTGNAVAQDTRIKISPKNTTAVNSQSFFGGVWASNANMASGSATVNISGAPQTITYIPGTAIWYPEHSFTPRYLNSSEEAALFSNSGFSLGNIDKDSTCPSTQTFCHQGSLAARFQIGSTVIPPVVYACNDGIDNDGDGLVDYPADPGCYGPTDNDEYNVILPTAYITASTQSATNISQNNATLNGTFSTNQSQSTVWFEWGTSQSLGYSTAHQTMYNSSGNFSAQISGLSQNTNYYFRACADTNATSQNCGSILNFITTHVPQNNAPTAVTISGNCNATQYSFNMAGSYYSNNSNNINTTTWFQYGTSYPYSIQVGNQTQYANSGNFNYTLSGLSPNTTYYFQAVAQNSAGMNYGTVLSCTTLPVQNNQYQTVPPVVTTVYASSVSQTSARLNGYLNSVGYTNCTPSYGSVCPLSVFLPTTNVWFEWGPTQALGYTTTQQNFTSPVTFSSYLPNLAPNTTYYFRAKAQNAFGVATGTILSFTTQNVNVGPKVIYVNTNTNTGGSGTLVSIDIKSDFGSVCTNDSLYYTVNYENLTKKTLKDAVVQVILPKEQTFMRATRGSFSADANTITVNVGDLSSREKGTLGIEARVNSRSKTTDTLVSTATIVYTNPTTKAQGDAIGYALVNVTCGNNMVGLALFADGLGCFGWLLIILIILLLIYLVRRAYRY